MLAKRPNRRAPAKMQHTRTVFTVLEGISVFTAGPQCDWFSVEDVVGEIPTSRTWVPHVDRDINMGRESGLQPERDPKCSLCDRDDRMQS